MAKYKKLILTLVSFLSLVFVFAFLFPKLSWAAEPVLEVPSSVDDSRTTLHFKITGLIQTSTYEVKIEGRGSGSMLKSDDNADAYVKPDVGGVVEMDVCFGREVYGAMTGMIHYRQGDQSETRTDPCQDPWEQVPWENNDNYTLKVKLKGSNLEPHHKEFVVDPYYPDADALTLHPDNSTPITIKVCGLRGLRSHYQERDNDYEFFIDEATDGALAKINSGQSKLILPLGDDPNACREATLDNVYTGQHTLIMREYGGDHFIYYTWEFDTATGTITKTKVTNGSNLSGPGGKRPEPCGTAGIMTALGCIETTTAGFINTFLTFAMGIAGGIAFLMMVFGAIRILTAAGNPESINSGREIIISALTGLLFIIFSVFLLHLIGIDIFGLPIPE